jgi:dCMP deaminase
MTDIFQSIETLYDNRENFIVIGLTGRTGSGCSSAGEFLSKTLKDIKFPKYKIVDDNEERKYRIIYNFIHKNWTPFVWIQIKDIITSFIIEKPYNEFASYVCSKLATSPDESAQILKSLDDDIKSEYEKIHEIRIDLKELRDKLDNSEIKKLSEIEDRRDQSHAFYFDTLPAFTEKLKGKLNTLSGDNYTKLYQIIGNNIRSSGDALSKNFNAKNIHRLAFRVNKLIKIFTNRSKKTNEKVLIVIDALRNPFEAIYLRERYSAFYLMSINTPEKDREYRLKKLLNLNDTQVENISKKEDDKRIEGKEFFYSQNVAKCIQLSDIHINNPQEGTNNFSTLKKQLAWYVALIMHPGIVTPTREERCMQLAVTAKLNSGCMSRQVGAIVTDNNFSVKGIGWNSSAEGQPPCIIRSVEHLLNHDDVEAYSDYEKNNVKFRDVLSKKYAQKLDDEEFQKKLAGRNVTYCFKDIQNELENKKNQVHTRSLHAEENAFLQIAKYGGQGIDGGKLFTTASPCELCSKKAFQLGISEIFFIDPYPGISQDHILGIGKKRPKLTLFHGAIGRAYNQLYEPILPYKDELIGVLNLA